jgi:preprotein translocase subunit YajC
MKTILLQTTTSEGSGMQSFIMIGLMALVFYFFMIRPQMKRSKEAKSFRESLAIGDKIITSGGIHGKVLEISDASVLISTESGKLRLEKSSVTMNDKDQLVNQKK